MTILEDPADELDVLLERRRAAAGPRLSWASTEPFVRHSREPLPAYDAANWGSESRRYVKHSVVTDLAVAALVVSGMLVLGRHYVDGSAWWLGVVALSFFVLVALGRGYDSKHLGDGPGEFQAIFRAGVGSAAVVALGSVALGVVLPRILVAVMVVVLTLCVALGRYGLRPFAARAPFQGHGDGAHARRR